MFSIDSAQIAAAIAAAALKKTMFKLLNLLLGFALLWFDKYFRPKWFYCLATSHHRTTIGDPFLLLLLL